MRETLVALTNRIKLKEANWQKKFICNLIETAFMLKDNYTFANVSELRKFLVKEKMTKIEILATEIESSVTNLIKENIIELRPFDNSLRMPEREVKRLEETTNAWLNIENEVKNDWVSNLKLKYSLSSDESEQLWESLVEKFIAIVLIRHGAESAQIIFDFPNPDESIVQIGAILRETTEHLSGHLKAIAMVEFPLFFTPSSSNRKKYLIGLLNCAFDQFSVAIPKEAMDEIYNTTNFELTIFLDTNFFFLLFGLDESHLSESVNDICSVLNKISISTNGRLKIKLRYMKDTEHEFVRTIDGYISSLKNTIPARSVAIAAVKSKKIGGVSLPYFQKIAKSSLPISIEEFLSPYKKGTRHILKDRGIEIYQDFDFENIRNSQIVIDDIHDHYKFLKDSGHERTWESVEHDVRLWHYVKQLRKDISKDVSFFQKKYFILTGDYRFIGFDKFRHRKELNNAFCLLPTQFLQILSFFIPRTDDFESALLHSMSMPIARAVDRETERTSLSILKSLSLYKDFSETVAFELLKDEAFRETVNNAEEPEEVRKIIEDTLSKKLEEEKKKNEEIIRKQSEMNKALQYKEISYDALKTELDSSRIKIKELEQSIQKLENGKTTVDKKPENNKIIKKKSQSYFRMAWQILLPFSFCVLIFLVLSAYVRWLSKLTDLLISVTIFVTYIYFKFQDKLKAPIKKIYRWVIKIGALATGLKTIWETFSKFFK